MPIYWHVNNQVGSPSDVGANNEPDEESVESEDVVSDDEQDLEEVEYESDLDDMVELTDEQSLPITMK